MPRPPLGAPSRFRRGPTAEREWVGGRFRVPLEVEGESSPPRFPELILWLELPEGLVVGSSVVEIEHTTGAVGRLLGDSMRRPLAGPPRRPARIRVASAALAAEVRGVVGDSVPVAVAPTPELDALFEEVVLSMADGSGHWSYVEDQRLTSEAVGELFAVAKELYECAPWRETTDDHVLRVDIPSLGVEGACLSIVGFLGQSLGFLLFPSLRDFERFAAVASEGPPDRGSVDLGTTWRSLTFDRRRDVSPALRREAKTYGWKIAGAAAFPVAESYQRDGTPLPLLPRDLEILTACTLGLVAFFEEHRACIDGPRRAAMQASYTVACGRDVRLGWLRGSGERTDRVGPRPVAEPVTARPEEPRFEGVGRNDPCPCGSGRKYKKCHLEVDRGARAARRASESVHERDERLVEKILAYAHETFGDRWFDYPNVHGAPLESTLQLVAPWSVYGYQIAAKTPAEHFVARHGLRLSDDDRAWIEAQLASWLSVWEVLAVEPGTGLELRDLLTGETAVVRERLASQTLVVRDTVLARIVRHEGLAVLCGIYPHSLPPSSAAEVVRRARGRLRRQGPIPPDKLRDGVFGAYLIRRWVEADAELQQRQALPPKLQNTDGDPLILTSDHYDLSPGARPAVEAGLAGIDGLQVDLPEPGQDPAVYVYLRAGHRKIEKLDNTVVGRALLRDSTLVLETNSRERGDALRALVEKACGDHLRFRIREHADPLSEKAQPPAADAEPEPEPAELLQLALQFKEHHYSDWADRPLPALAGRTPRAAARTKRGREAVDLLLKDMENQEGRLSPGAAFDFSRIRRELGIE